MRYFTVGRKLIYKILILFLGTLGIAACSVDTSVNGQFSTQNGIEKIKIVPSFITINKGYTEDFKVYAVYSSGLEEDITNSPDMQYAFSNAGIASMLGIGTINGTAVGSSKLFVSYSNNAGSADVNVINNGSQSINTNRAQLKNGDHEIQSSANFKVYDVAIGESSHEKVATGTNLKIEGGIYVSE